MYLCNGNDICGAIAQLLAMWVRHNTPDPSHKWRVRVPDWTAATGVDQCAHSVNVCLCELPVEVRC
jgi:hypothetical protein